MYNPNPQEEFKEIQKSATFRRLVKTWRENGFDRNMAKRAAKAFLVKPKDKKSKHITFAEDEAALL